MVALIDVERDQSSVGSSLTVAGSYAWCDDQFCASQTLSSGLSVLAMTRSYESSGTSRATDSSFS